MALAFSTGLKSLASKQRVPVQSEGEIISKIITLASTQEPSSDMSQKFLGCI
jgi:hypothetical protein